MTDSAFADLVAANRAYAESFDTPGLTAPADAELAVVTCMDSRIDPLALLGLGLGDAKVIRNPGGQVTDDALTALVLATSLLACRRIAVIEHTRCAMASADDAGIARLVGDATGFDTSGFTPGAIADQHERIAADIQRIRDHALIGDDVEVGGFVYDVDTGLLEQVA